MGAGGRIVSVRAYLAHGEGGAPGTEIVWVLADPAGGDGSAVPLIAPSDRRVWPRFTAGSDRIHVLKGSAVTVPTRGST